MPIYADPLENLKYWVQVLDKNREELNAHCYKYNTTTDESSEFHLSFAELYAFEKAAMSTSAHISLLFTCLHEVEEELKRLRTPWYKKILRRK